MEGLGPRLLNALTRVKQIEQSFGPRRQILGPRAQQFLWDKHLRVDGFVYALHHTRLNHLSIEPWRDANQLPAHALEGSLHVRVLQRGQAVDHPHSHRSPQSFLEQKDVPTEMRTSMLGRDCTNASVQHFAIGVSLH